MRAGDLRTPIILKKPVRTPDAATAEMITTYETVATVWSAVEWGSGRRFESAKQLNAEVEGVVRIRYRTDIKADWRIGLGRRTIQILSLANVRERNEELVLTCKETQD
jgi:SPP1 family predicted phage head-tail adaptor